MRRRVWTCICVLMVCVMAAPLRAATVAGRVTDATGAGIPGARVVLKDQATGKEEAVETSADGQNLFNIFVGENQHDKPPIASARPLLVP